MTIVNPILDMGHTAPSRPALVTRVGTWSYGDLLMTTREIEAVLSPGMAPTTRVAVVMTAEGEAVAALLAVLAAGSSAILLPSALRPSDLLHYLAVARARFILLPPGAHSSQSVIGTSHPPEVVRGVAVIPLRGRDETDVDGDRWIMQLTSGSLGPARLAARTTRGVEDEILAVSDRLNLRGDVILCTTSLAHSYALCGGLLAGLATGSTVVLPGDRETILETLCETRPSVVFGIVGTYRSLLDSPDRLPASVLRRLRLALCAGAPLPPAVFTQVKDRLALAIRQDYGTTETGTIAIDTSASPQPDQAGIPLRHLEVQLSSFESGRETEILIRSPSTARFYLDTHGHVSCLDGEGRFHTGDAGRINDKARLVLGRRIRPAVQIANVWIDPGEVERRLAQLPSVREVAVLVVPAIDGQQQLKAVVVAPHLTTDDVRGWCRQNLSPEQQPALLELRNALPRSPAGKILHRDLLGPEQVAALPDGAR